MSFKRLQQIIVRVAAIAVALTLVFCVGLFAYRSFFGYDYDSSLYGKDLAAGVQADENITNIALFGLDTREGDTQSHSDCTMIITVDNTRGKIKITSLMRDSLVEIDGHGRDKLNAAYFLGGSELGIRTINQNFGTDITEYISVEFAQLVEIIEAIGGVEIDVQDFELDELNRVIRDYGIEQDRTFSEVAAPGKQTLTGVQALCYGRIRKGGTGDDWGRVERQSIVLTAMFEKVQSRKAGELIGLAQQLLPYVATSLSPTELAPLIVGALKDGTPTIEHTRVPLDTEWEYAGASSEYISYDLDKAAEHIRAYIYDDVFPGDSSAAHAPSTPSPDDEHEPDDGASQPIGDVDLDEEPTGPAGGTAGSDPAALAEEGGGYDPSTGDYWDSDGDYYRLDEDGTRLYYDQETYNAGGE